jgi:hypothetical protein
MIRRQCGLCFRFASHADKRFDEKPLDEHR